MSLSNESETALLKLLLQNIAWANIGDASGLQPAGTAGSLYISLHTADPGEAGDQTTSEADYTGYARVAVARSAAGWTVADANCSNAAAVTFGACSAGTNTITYFGIGTAAAAAGHLVASGVLDAQLAVSAGITPSFAINALDIDAT